MVGGWRPDAVRTALATLMLGILPLVGGGCNAGVAGVRVREFRWETPAGEARGYAAWVDLNDPRVEIVVTSPALDAPPGTEARLVPTDEWAATEKVDLAVNANYFGARGAWADVIGLCVSDGEIVSPARTFAQRPDPALVFWADGSASAGHHDGVGVRDAIAGVGGSEAEPDAGTLLVADGRNLGPGARVAPTVRHPRTAAGVSADGRSLILLVVDGRQPGWSVGMTLPELGEAMRSLGADDALNLDGGGSSSFIYVPRGPGTGDIAVNRPSDGRHRPVASHLGIRVHRGDEDPRASVVSGRVP